ncbi:MAG: fructosamine kinase family protein [Gemmatimonadota bacterium]|jgi:fructosamine-3-kinase
MTLPAPVIQGVEEALEAETGKPARIVSSASAGGGCINPSARIVTESGDDFFLKWNASAPSSMFPAEADGLRALRSPGTLKVPEVFGQGGSGAPGDPGWLLMEFIPQGRPGPTYGERLGAGLAALHSSRLHRSEPASGGQTSGTPPTFGWYRDNFIGSLPQKNEENESWVAFWREFRLAPQLQMARDRGHFSGGRARVVDELLNRLDQVMAGSEEGGPALLHGDLWSGNFYPDPEGQPVLIDPAVYLGVGEVDLAMMELFGSLPRGFEESYGDARGWAPEYEAFRRSLYQLYYLLVHVNLFGGSYVGSSLQAAERALSGA